MKNEAVFGSTLEELQNKDDRLVPKFVLKCIQCIEKEDFLKTDGIYRVAGSLAEMQSIRFQVDEDKLDVLDEVKDVHILTGCLKLFFRELKEPLIPWNIVSIIRDQGIYRKIG